MTKWAGSAPRGPWPAAAQGLRAAPPASRGGLLGVHTEEYLRSLRRPGVVTGILEVPIVRRLPGWVIDWRILRFATGGTLLTCRLALEHGIAAPHSIMRREPDR